MRERLQDSGAWTNSMQRAENIPEPMSLKPKNDPICSLSSPMPSECLCYTRVFATNHVILNHGQVTRTTPELTPPLLTTNERMFEFSTDLTCIAALHAGFLVVLGWNSWQGQPQSDTLTTRLPLLSPTAAANALGVIVHFQ
ncbi:hypothetical protein TNCV_3604211 [Trichonephila clavipes]|nr:hypothetical protein TNCV_3604211 [Trichonephila clavipes]